MTAMMALKFGGPGKNDTLFCSEKNNEVVF
jgi:hypothetical protein